VDALTVKSQLGLVSKIKKVEKTRVYLIGVYLMGVHLTGVHLMGVHLIDVYLMACTS
jgi:hypothetical protein